MKPFIYPKNEGLRGTVIPNYNPRETAQCMTKNHTQQKANVSIFYEVRRPLCSQRKNFIYLFISCTHQSQTYLFEKKTKKKQTKTHKYVLNEKQFQIQIEKKEYLVLNYLFNSSNSVKPHENVLSTLNRRHHFKIKSNWWNLRKQIRLQLKNHSNQMNRISQILSHMVRKNESKYLLFNRSLHNGLSDKMQTQSTEFIETLDFCWMRRRFK